MQRSALLRCATHLALAAATVDCSLDDLTEGYGVATPPLDPEVPPNEGPDAETEALELSVVADFGGRVAIDVVDVRGAGTFTRRLARGRTIDLRLSDADRLVARFSGDCEGSTCSLTMDGPKRVSLRVSPFNLMFVTSEKYTGNLGGSEGADERCERLARAANLPGHFVAWISAPDDTAQRRLRSGGWMRLDGRPFARSLADLVQGKNLYPPRIDEAGRDIAADLVWSDNDPITNARTASDCKGWTSADSTLRGMTGSSAGGRSEWFLTAYAPCDRPTRLYCLGNDLATEPPRPAPTSAPRIFVSKATVAPNAGLATFDTICRTEANTAGLSTWSKFKALVVPLDGMSPRSRVQTALSNEEGTGWTRMDGVAVAKSSLSFFEGATWLAPIDVTAQGESVRSSQTFTGYAAETVTVFPGLTTQGSATCGGWSSLVGKAGVGRSGRSDLRAYIESTEDCATATPRSVYCIED